MKTIALDTETTGVDFRHGAVVFLVTITDDQGETLFWEWPVDPLTRGVNPPPEDRDEIIGAIAEADRVVIQNAKFDITALSKTLHYPIEDWPWHKTEDTLFAGHLLASNIPHDLTSMAIQYLGVDISKHEISIGQAAKEARRWAKTNEPDWNIAKPKMPMMPSAKGEVWKFDMWLPKAVADYGYGPAEWSTLCTEYANADSAVALLLWQEQMRLIEERGLMAIYKERLKLLPIVCKMEEQGVTLSGRRYKRTIATYESESAGFSKECKQVVAEVGAEPFELPKSGVNNSLREFVFETLGLPPVVLTNKGKPSLGAKALDTYLATLHPEDPPYRFVRALRGKRKRDTAVAYLDGYRRFWRPVRPLWYRLHPSLNPTGTHTLRWSSSNPNEQNISKQEGFNLRYAFGPAPGREWWSLDAENIELRIPAYEAEEREQIALFENPSEPPYFGSNHLLTCHILHPEMFEECLRDGVSFKDRYKSTWYQWTKNGNFAVQYGAMESSGTADAAYHVPGAQHRIQERFSKVAVLNASMIAHAQRYGYVETMPDKTVDPDRGYPLWCNRDRNGNIRPTVPLNYHVQGTAMWWMAKAMTRCAEYLEAYPGHYLIMQVHDELVFDFPQGKGRKPWMTNLPKVREIKTLMERGGDDIGVPTPVSIEYHGDNWSEGIRAKC